MINPWNFTDPSSTYIQIHFACILIYHIDILYIHICIYICMYVHMYYIYILMCISNIFIYIYRSLASWSSLVNVNIRCISMAGKGFTRQGSGRAVRCTTSGYGKRRQSHCQFSSSGHQRAARRPRKNETASHCVYTHIIILLYIHRYIYMCVYIIELTTFIYCTQVQSFHMKKTYIFIYIRLYIYNPAIYELSITYSLGWP
jgi:hypothetical protein